MKVRQDVRSVYLMLNEENGRVKIGFSSNPKKRLKTIINHSGCRVKLYHYTKPIYNYADVERGMHALFSESRGIGEWFVGISLNNAVKNLNMLSSTSEVCRIVRMYEAGKNATYIADQLKVSRSGVLKYLISVGSIDKDTVTYFSNLKIEKPESPKIKKTSRYYDQSDFKGFTKGDIAEMVRKNNIKMGRTKNF